MHNAGNGVGWLDKGGTDNVVLFRAMSEAGPRACQKFKLVGFVYGEPVRAQKAKIVSPNYFYQVPVVRTNKLFRENFFELPVLPAPEEKLGIYKLRKSSPTGEIIEDLGAFAEIGVTQFRDVLLANRESSHWFLCFLRGRSGLAAVSACWSSKLCGWEIDQVPSVHGVLAWEAGRTIIARKRLFTAA